MHTLNSPCPTAKPLSLFMTDPDERTGRPWAEKNEVTARISAWAKYVFSLVFLVFFFTTQRNFSSHDNAMIHASSPFRSLWETLKDNNECTLSRFIAGLGTMDASLPFLHRPNQRIWHGGQNLVMFSLLPRPRLILSVRSSGTQFSPSIYRSIFARPGVNLIYKCSCLTAQQ